MEIDAAKSPFGAFLCALVLIQLCARDRKRMSSIKILAYSLETQCTQPSLLRNESASARCDCAQGVFRGLFTIQQLIQIIEEERGELVVIRFQDG